MDISEQEKLERRLNELKVEHFDLDDIIKRLQEDPTIDQLQIQRLKKRKLSLKDMITRLQSRLIPDIEA
jgi:hypothetical protein